MNHQVKKRTGRGGVSCIARRKRSFNTLIIFFLLFAAASLTIGTTSAEAMEMDFNIPAQALSSALKTFAEDTGLQMLYSSDTVKGIRSNGVNGKHQPKEALDILLSNTGLSFKFTDSNTVVVQNNKGRKGGKLVAQREVEKREEVKKKEEVKRPVEIEEMVVTATKSEMNVREVPAAVNVVTAEDIKLRARTDNFYDAIRNVPGVHVTEAVIGASSMTIRGKSSAIMVNGRDMNRFMNRGLLDAMLVGTGAVERIEVLKGPQGAIYGSSAVSGVVNVILKKGDKDHPYVETRGFYGEGDEISGGLSLSGGYDKLSYFLDLSAAEQDKYKTPEGTIPYVDYKRKNVYSRFDYAFSDDQEITFEYTYNDQERTVGGEGYFYERSPRNKIFKMDTKFQGGYLSYRGDFTDWFSLYASLGIAQNEMNHISGGPNYEPDHFLDKENMTDCKEDILLGEIRGTFNLLADYRLRTIVGLQYKQIELDSYAYTTWMGIRKDPFGYSKKEECWAPYAQVEFKPIPHVLMVGGVRYDDYDTDGKKESKTSPNVGLSLFPFAHTDYNWTTIWASWSEAFRTPTAFERYDPRWGNPDLGPEESEGWEIGLKQRIRQWANLEFSYFDTEYKNLIAWETTGPTAWIFFNIAEARRKGYELLLEVYPTDWSTLHFGYADLDRTDQTTGESLYGIPGKTFQYGLTLNDLYGFNFSVWGEQHSDYKIDETTNHPSEDDIIWNTKLLYRWNITEKALFEPFVSFENLTDKKYYGPPADVNIMEGRAWHVGASLRVNF